MANKISVSALIADFQTMLREKWAYAWGACKRGEVDCAGAFAWAFKQHGRSVYQGSNRMARVEVERLIPIGDATLAPGMAAFKCRAPGEKGYDLKACYKAGGAYFNGDLNDYYHVGLIDEDVARVLNAQGSATGFVASPISKGWSHVGYLKQVDYGTDAQEGAADDELVTQPTMTPSSVATVYADNGLPVKMRDKPSESCRSWVQLPVGTVVTLRGPYKDGWTPVRYGSRDGYMMTKFLQVTAQTADGTSYAVTFYDLKKDQAEELMASHNEYMSLLEERHG